MVLKVVLQVPVHEQLVVAGGVVGVGVGVDGRGVGVAVATGVGAVVDVRVPVQALPVLEEPEPQVPEKLLQSALMVQMKPPSPPGVSALSSQRPERVAPEAVPLIRPLLYS